jgi:polyphosphate kinase
VKSVLGRFLEHSRIFHFINAGDHEYWIGSADLMGRNLDRRVESLVRIDKKDHQNRLQEILDLGLSPNSSSWQLSGIDWTRVSKNKQGEALLDVHSAFIHTYSKDR